MVLVGREEVGIMVITLVALVVRVMEVVREKLVVIVFRSYEDLVVEWVRGKRSSMSAP